jgi:hypothetical protein
MNNPNTVPAAIEDLVKKLLDTNQKQYVRDNHKNTVMNIIDYCSMAIREYERKRK